MRSRTGAAAVRRRPRRMPPARRAPAARRPPRSQLLRAKPRSRAAASTACRAAVSTTASRSQSKSGAEPDSSLRSGERQARSRRNDETPSTGTSIPARGAGARGRARRSARHSRVQVGLGHDADRDRAALRAPGGGTPPPGAVSSCEASVTKIDAAAWPSAPQGDDPVRGVETADAGGVDEAQPGAAAGGAAAGPRPSAAAAASSASAVSETSSREPVDVDRDALERDVRRGPAGRGRVLALGFEDRRAGRRVAVPDERRHGVTMSASTGQTSVCSTALTSVLLPRLNSPTTATANTWPASRRRARLQVLAEVGPVELLGDPAARVERGEGVPDRRRGRAAGPLRHRPEPFRHNGSRRTPLRRGRSRRTGLRRDGFRHAGFRRGRVRRTTFRRNGFRHGPRADGSRRRRVPAEVLPARGAELRAVRARLAARRAAVHAGRLPRTPSITPSGASSLEARAAARRPFGRGRRRRKSSPA